MKYTELCNFCLACRESKRMNHLYLSDDYECSHCRKGICQKCSCKLIDESVLIWRERPNDYRTDKKYLDIKRKIGLDPNFNLYEREDTLEHTTENDKSSFMFCGCCVVDVDNGKYEKIYGKLRPTSNSDYEI